MATYLKPVLVALLALTFTEGKSLKQEPVCNNEQYRPRYHFSPEKNWSNDPNGLVYYNGTFHLYFQYHPFSSQSGPQHWGHAVSKDLATWEEVNIALEPDELGFIWSGSAVVDFDNSTGFKTDSTVDPIVAVFTHATGEGYSIQRQSIAYSNDYGMTFTKFEGNPVLVDPNSPDFRDPKVRRYENKWVMVLAVRNRIEFFSSPDLKSWTKISEFGASPEEGNHGGTWECPDFFPMEVKLENGSTTQVWVLVVSVGSGGPNRGSGTQYFVGNFDGETFTTFQWHDTQWVDWGPDNYAGVTYSNDPKQRAVSIGWMTNLAYAGSTPTVEYRGQMTLPRKLSLHTLNETTSQYRITSTPAEELEALRNPLQYFAVDSDFVVSPQTVITLSEPAPFKNSLMELEITLEIEGQPKFAICAYNSNGEEVCFGMEGSRWYLDRAKTGNIGFSGEYAQMLHSTAAREISDSKITIKMFVDASSIEVFADDGLTAMTSLYYSNEPLDMLYINHWSAAGSEAAVKVDSYKLWGLLCVRSSK